MDLIFFFLFFGSRSRTKKGREFPEVTGQDLKEKRKRNTRFKEDVCKHVRKRLPGAELTGRGCLDGDRDGDLKRDSSSCRGWKGQEGGFHHQ